VKDAIRVADGSVIAHGWLTPETLIAMGDSFAATAELTDD
jgi:hypothetical protein